MRPIDADELLKLLYKDIEILEPLSVRDKYIQNAIVRIKCDIEIIESMPTVDTERHGHWIEELASQHGNAYDGRTWTKYKKYRCSYCGITNGNRRPDYCPHCGAEMNKERSKL